MPATKTSAPRTLTDLLFDKVGQGLCLVAPDGTVLRASAEWLRSTGFVEEQVVGENIIELLPSTRDMALALHARVRAGHRVEVSRHARIVAGRETWWEGSIDPVPMEGGTGLLITAREVSEAVVGARAIARTEDEPNVAAERLSQDLDAMTRLHRLSTRFVRAGDLPQPALEEIVDAAISITHADMGNIQLLDPGSRTLEIAAYRGHEKWWVDFFESVPAGAGAACGAALQQVSRVIVEDVTKSPVFVGTPALEVQLRAGIRAVQSTPLIGSSGDLVGMISTHYRTPRRPDERDLRLLDVLARQAADMIERVRSEEALQRISSELRRTLDTAATGLTHCSRDLRYVSANAAYARWIGLPVEQIIGRPIVEVMGEAAFEVIRPRVERVLAGERVEFEDELPIDGRLEPVHVVYTPDVAASGSVVGWVAGVTDVSERRRAEEELAVMTRLYAVLSRVNEAIVRTRTEQPLFEEVCRTVAEDGGFPLVWVGLVKDREVVPVASSGRAVEYLREVRVEIDGKLSQGPTGTCIREDHPVINDDFGTNPTTWPWREASARHGLRASAAFPLHRGGAVIGSLTFYAAQPGAFTAKQVKLVEALCADISYALDAIRAERRRTEAENRLRESDERFRAAFEASPDAININRMRDGAYVMVNDGFARLSGWARPEVLGMTAVDLRIWADPEQRSRMLNRLLAGELIQSEETAFRRKDGSVFSASISAKTFRAGGEEFLLAVTRDVSDVKRVEAALLEADRRKDDFLAMLSHELRNPLAPIRNSTYILQRAEPGSEQARRAQSIIDRQTEHLTRLVDDLLDVTRIARGKIEVRRSLVDLRGVVWRAADDFGLLMRDRGVRFDVVVPDEPLWVEADATRITQIVGNLLHNASKFTQGGDVVALSVGVKDGAAEICVRDSGAGIDREVLPRIFDAFTQGTRTLARSEGGLGLGLATVKGIAELHGGSVRAESAGAGKGAEFIVRLPLADSAPAGRDVAGQMEPSTGCRRVLVVDDNRDAAESLADLVKMLGHAVKVAYDGANAVEKARAYRPDVVLCDLGLPGMSGYDVARALRADPGNGVQLIAVSGYAQPEDVQRAIEAGFDGHVAKPCDLQEIERLLS
jgi:PAS domain S-box-containing protein